MELWLLWTIVGFVLVITELVTGTFYLLVLGLGAFIGAIAAWLGANHIVQALAGGGSAVAGTWFVHHWHESRRTLAANGSNFLDRGQPVVLDGWANENAGIDNINVAFVPEPASLGALAIGSLVLLKRRRRV